jgi:hypothetical protein
MTMTPVTIAFLMAGGLGLIGIILVLIFDRPKTPKGNPDNGQENAKGASHRL